MTVSTDRSEESFDWQPQPDAYTMVREILQTFLDRCTGVAKLARTLHRQTATRLLDWIDHLAIPRSDLLENRLTLAGFVSYPNGGRLVWKHPNGAFPVIEMHAGAVRRMAIRVDSVADFLVAQRCDADTTISAEPLSQLRRAKLLSDSAIEVWGVERHGFLGWEPPAISPGQAEAVVRHQEAFRRRPRYFPNDDVGFDSTLEVIRSAANDLGVDWACDLFFAAEREYWTMRNRAARIQRGRQDALGLGWGNHDHHTYRSSRRHFHRLIAVMEELGLRCRERFYAGHEAGWGAQVLEQPTCGIVVFADVDLAPDEVGGDFAHEPLATADHLGTVGLWCMLHGDAFLQAGMHHLECRYDFDAARRQLHQQGIETMAPFTDLPYLKQAFTQGEVWPVDAARLQAAVAVGAVTREQADRFREYGVIGSHLEILQREDGYKGFNKSGISEIIKETDPRKWTPDERPADPPVR